MSTVKGISDVSVTSFSARYSIFLSFLGGYLFVKIFLTDSIILTFRFETLFSPGCIYKTACFSFGSSKEENHGSFSKQ